MALREQLNRHPIITSGVSLIAIALVGVWVAFHSMGSTIPKQQSFYTTDDGATLFADDFEKVPPFDHNGQQAVRAFVFTCDDGKHQFVQYLQKYADDVKARIEAGGSRDQIAMGLIKKPGASEWIRESDLKAVPIVQQKCPDGKGGGTYRQVYP